MVPKYNDSNIEIKDRRSHPGLALEIMKCAAFGGMYLVANLVITALF